MRDEKPHKNLTLHGWPRGGTANDTAICEAAVGDEKAEINDPKRPEAEFMNVQFRWGFWA